MTFGPWLPNLDPTERVARTRALRALAGVFCHQHQNFVDALRAAEDDPAALGEALRLLNALPALNRRRLLASYGGLARQEGRLSRSADHVRD